MSESRSSTGRIVLFLYMTRRSTSPTTSLTSYSKNQLDAMVFESVIMPLRNSSSINYLFVPQSTIALMGSTHNMST